MLEMITAACAVTAFATEMKAVSMAGNPKYANPRYSVDYNKPVRAEACFEEYEEETVTPKFTVRPRQLGLSEKRELLANRQKRENNPMLDFIFNNIDYLLEISKHGGTIPNDKLNGVDTDMVMDFMFKQPTVESVEMTPDGMVITPKR